MFMGHCSLPTADFVMVALCYLNGVESELEITDLFKLTQPTREQLVCLCNSSVRQLYDEVIALLVIHLLHERIMSCITH